LVGVIALLVPALAVASSLNGDQEKQDLSVAASGPASPPTSEVPPAVLETSTTHPEPTSSTTTEVREPVTTIRANAGPADDPVVRRTTPTAAPRPATTTNTTTPDIVASTTVPPPDVTVPTTALTYPACPVPDVLVTVTTGKAAYALGESVYYEATFVNRSSIICLIPAGAWFTVYDGTGRLVGPPIAWTGGNTPVRAGTDTEVTASNSWDQQDCLVKDSTCVQAPAGTYTVKAEGKIPDGPTYKGSASFGLGA